jgi:hypothetical protein
MCNYCGESPPDARHQGEHRYGCPDDVGSYDRKRVFAAFCLGYRFWRTSENEEHRFYPGGSRVVRVADQIVNCAWYLGKDKGSDDAFAGRPINEIWWKTDKAYRAER